MFSQNKTRFSIKLCELGKKDFASITKIELGFENKPFENRR
jgi:hypothetical protein